ncbi:MAG: PP2C family protein-serine/threonine phosphatase [Acidimicrobiales bacterium]
MTPLRRQAAAPRSPVVPDPPGTAHPRRSTTGRRLHLLTVVVLVAGLVVTAVLVVASAISYHNNEERLTTLESRLSASLLATAPAQLEAQLGRVAGLVAESPDPAATFVRSIDPSLAPSGPYASAVLVAVDGGVPHVLDHVGAPSIHSVHSTVAASVFVRAAGSTSLVTTRVVGRRVQRLGYFMSAQAGGEAYVVGASQQFPLHDVVHLPDGVIGRDLEFAVYYGRHVDGAALIGANVPTPLSGTVSTSTVVFGSSTLTLVVSPRGSLSGPWTEYLPWALLGVGIVLTATAAGTTEWMVRRRDFAEQLAVANRQLYRQEREVATTLQHALLPKALPDVPGLDLAARYLPAATGVEIGGDWYSLITVGGGRVVFVVGDVSGHGVAAASVMGAMRHLTRALARLGASPSEILDRANEEIDIGADDHFATVLVGAFHLGRPELVLASAGHLPPLVVGPGGATFAALPTGPPLGVVAHHYESLVVAFPEGSTLLAYTDGLVEHRGRSIDDGLSQLASVAGHGAPTAAALLDRVVGDLVGEDNEDDMAALAIRR